MIDPSWLAVPLGAGLIAVTLLDVFMTVLHVQVESPLSNRVQQGFWRGLLAVGRMLPRGARDGVLAWGMPSMIGGTFILWAALYIHGFALVFLPVIQDPGVFSVEHPTVPLIDSLYFSASTFFSIGYGDVLPIHPLARLLAVVEGGCGLLTIALSATYLLSVYPLITRKITLAASLNEEMDGRSDGVAVAERYVAAGRFEALGDRLRSLHDDLLYLGQAHGFYPVLYYVRPRAVHESFVRILTLVQGLVATLRYGLDPSAHREVVTDPRLLILEEGLLYTLHELSASAHLTPSAEDEEDPDAADSAFRALLGELATCGVTPVSVDDRAAREGHARFRIATDPYIRAYAVNVGYDPEDVWGVYTRRDRGSSPSGSPEK